MAKTKFVFGLLCVITALYIHITLEHGTNVGKEFILMFLEEVRDGVPMQLSMTTYLQENVQVRIQTPLWQSVFSIDTTVTVVHGAITLVNISETVRMVGDTKDVKSILVTASGNIIIFATSSQFAIVDSFIVYPTESLGMEYVAISYNDSNKMTARLGCVTLYNNTNINVTVPFETSMNFDGSQYSDAEVIQIQLNEYETFQITGSDVTGSVIASDQNVACFSGNRYTHVSCSSDAEGSDHLAEQLLPVSAWSYRYIVVSNPLYSIGEIVRIVVFHNKTFISIFISNSGNCFNVELCSGMFHEIFLNSSDTAVIQADQPILVAQISCSSGRGSGKGDARLMISPSGEHFLQSYLFLTPALNLSVEYNYDLLVIAETDVKDFITINEEQISTLLEWKDISNSGFHYGQMTLTTGVYNLESDHSGSFGGCLYGYYLKSEFGTSIGRDMSTKQTGEIVPTTSSAVKYRTVHLRMEHEDKLPAVTEVMSMRVNSLISCMLICAQYSTCYTAAYDDEQGLCLVYSINVNCFKLVQSPGYNLYIKTN